MRGIRGWVVILVLPCLAGTAFGPAAAQSVGAPGTGFPSNLGLLNQLTREAAAEAADGLNLEPGAAVTILSSTWHEANWFIGGSLAEVLAARGHKVKVIELARPPEAAPTGGSGQAPAPRGGSNLGGANRPRNQQGLGGTGAGTGSSVGGGAQSGGLDGIMMGDDNGAVGDTTGAHADSLEALRLADPLWGSPGDEGDEPEDADPSLFQPALTPPPVAGERMAIPEGIPAGHVLDVRVLEFGVNYADIGRRLLFGPVQFTRVGGVFLQVSHLNGPEGDLQCIVSAERHRVDRLSGRQRSLAEGASYPFTKPSMAAPSLGRYVEPTVVVAIVGSLIYLFYSNQN